MGKLRTITVARLIDMLEGESPDALVIVSADYGDYHHTTQALPLRGELETVTVEKSAYSHSGFAIAEPEDCESDEDGADETFLLIR